jgi:ADP-heptose:LPS heptosyltransferase
LAEQGLEVILTGSAGETGLVEEVMCRMNRRAVNLAGKLSLGGLAALLKSSRLLICNDTGVSHLADALEVQSVVIFSRSDPQVWAPLDRQLHRVIVSPAKDGFVLPHYSFTPLTGDEAVTRVLGEANQLLNQADPVSI